MTGKIIAWYRVHTLKFWRRHVARFLPQLSISHLLVDETVEPLFYRGSISALEVPYLNFTQTAADRFWAVFELGKRKYPHCVCEWLLALPCFVLFYRYMVSHPVDGLSEGADMKFSVDGPNLSKFTMSVCLASMSAGAFQAWLLRHRTYG